MKRNLGGDRIGSGAKIKVDMSGFGRSTFNQSRTWKSTAGVGMLIPCFMELGTNGTTFDIDIRTLGHTIPTIGPLFDGYKLQVDLFACPIRLYQGILHNNAVNIGLKMDQVLYPNITLAKDKATKISATNPSSLLNYLDIKGYHPSKKTFNAIPILAYYDIFKNYYSNKQEENAKALGWRETTTALPDTKVFLQTGWYGPYPVETQLEYQRGPSPNNYVTDQVELNKTNTLKFVFAEDIDTYEINEITIITDVNTYQLNTKIKEGETIRKDNIDFTREGNEIRMYFIGAPEGSEILTEVVFEAKKLLYEVIDFPLENIDEARKKILARTELGKRIILENDLNFLPYSLNFENDDIDYLTKDFQGLMLKTYQSDIFNNWLNTENIDLINEISSIAVTEQDSITIDAMIMAKKVYNVLNRIAVAGGTYEDWQESVYGQNAIRRAESPIYIGGTSAQIQFEEVVSTAQTQINETYQPLGNLGGKGAMINKKGGSVIYKCEEPTIILGIASITPYVNYSQGNSWIMTNLDNMDNLHKPELDGIGFENLIANNVHWRESPEKGLAKSTAWIKYQTAVDQVYGQFAIPKGEANSLYFMTLQRDYEIDEEGNITDFTTYIDPSKYNYAFADNSLTAQNFWLQIGFNVKSRRVMAAYQIPNL